MTFAACEAWAAAVWLRDHSMPFPDPPCGCDPECCPPLTTDPIKEIRS